MEQLRKVLVDMYNLSNPLIESTPGGWSADAYLIINNKQKYFLKVYDKTRASTKELITNAELYNSLIMDLNKTSKIQKHVNEPILNKDKKFVSEDDFNYYILYKYIAGVTIGNQKLNNKEMTQLGVLLSEIRKINYQSLIYDYSVIEEKFNIDIVAKIEKELIIKFNLLPSELQELLLNNLVFISNKGIHLSQLKNKIKDQEIVKAITHTDLHGFNLMKKGNDLIIIDWENVKIAPIEADLIWFYQEENFDYLLKELLKQNKNYKLNIDLIEYYVTKRYLEDLWEYCEQIIVDNNKTVLNAVTRLLNEFKEYRIIP